MALYHHIKSELKGKRNQGTLLDGVMDKAYDGGFPANAEALKDSAFNAKKVGGGEYSFRIYPAKYEEQYEFWWDIRNSLIVRKNGKLSLKKPLKKDFPLATNKTRHFDLGEASISFSDDTKKTVIWDVPENNHAPERARDYSLARTFFYELGRIKWTRGSGGEITGNNEYNRDDYESGGGANYVVSEYSLKAAKEEAELKKMLSRRSFPAMRRYW